MESLTQIERPEFLDPLFLTWKCYIHSRWWKWLRLQWRNCYLAILEGGFLINVLTHDIWLKFDFLSKRRSKNAFSGNVLKNWQKYLHTTLTTCIISFTSHTPVFDVNATTVERVHRVHRQGRNLPHKAESPPLVQNQPFHSTSPKYQLVYPLPSQRICPHTCMVQT